METSYAPEDMSFLLYMQAHQQIMFLTAILTAGAVILIVCLLMRSKWRQQLLEATEQANKRLEEQLSIVDALSRSYLNVYAVNAATASARIVKLEGYATTGLSRDSKQEFSYETVLQRYIQERVYPEDREALTEALSLKRVVENLSPEEEYSGTYRILIGGEIHYFQYTYVASNWEVYQKTKMFLAGFRNIDDIVKKELEQKARLSEALAEAQHANAAKTMFLNNMSHDIRTPMNAIIGFTSLAVAHIDHTEQVRDYLEKIMTSSKHLLSLINDVLDMSRIESGKVKIEEVEASLPEIMHDLKTIVQADVKAKHLEFFVDTLDVVNETIICDKLRLNQVLLNLLSNAMKYTKPGGVVSVRIVQAGDAPAGYAAFRFHVKDTGIGMSKQFLEHLFEPFEREQTATVSGIQGTGLGMAITKNIVDMMNGTIAVSSEEGVGTEFVVSFRFRVPDGQVSVEPLEHLRNLRALVVDDDVHTCNSVSKMLASVGLRPDWTTQGKEAVIRTEFAVEQNDPFTVFVIDWLLPDLSGIETVRQIRKIIGEDVHIIILTAYDWTDIEDEAREAGVTAFCSKPLFLSELRSILAAPAQAREETAAEEEQQLLSGKKILLVEDNELNQEIARTVLEESGFAVDTASDGTEAVEIIRTVPADTYDLILMDIQMPVMDGYTAARTIRGLEDPKKAGIPIVAMTANAFEEDRQRALEAGMNSHIPKPIDIPMLMGTLKDILLTEP